MDKAAEDTIKNWIPQNDISVSILETDHPEQKTFTRFAEKWAKLSSTIGWETAESDATLPGFALKGNIIYSALPMERELAPFLNGLETLGTVPSLFTGILSDTARNLLDQIQLPCDLTLYIALQCPHCPAMVDTLIPLAAYSDKIRLHIIDGSLFPGQAQADQVMAAPCLILDKGFRWTGAVPDTEILAMILNRNPAGLGKGTLQNILEDGDADWITREMIQAGKIFKGFMGLILHQTWSVRLGAMVVVESLAEQAPQLGLTLAPALIEKFEGQDISTQGDILYALGEIGSLETKAWIRECAKGLEHADLKEAAMDAVEAIESRLAL